MTEQPPPRHISAAAWRGLPAASRGGLSATPAAAGLLPAPAAAARWHPPPPGQGYPPPPPQVTRRLRHRVTHRHPRPDRVTHLPPTGHPAAGSAVGVHAWASTVQQVRRTADHRDVGAGRIVGIISAIVQALALAVAPDSVSSYQSGYDLTAIRSAAKRRRLHGFAASLCSSSGTSCCSCGCGATSAYRWFLGIARAAGHGVV